MVDEERFLARLARLELDLAELEKLRDAQGGKIATDVGARWAAERGLHVVIEGILDLGAHVLGSEFQIQGTTYRETAERMVEKGVVTVSSFPRIASFRNVLVHEYVDLDAQIVADLMAGGIDDLSACVDDLRRRAWQKSRG
jgi:uncharacterized protein YutE (UPF0331/DUF86 family)